MRLGSGIELALICSPQVVTGSLLFWCSINILPPKKKEKRNNKLWKRNPGIVRLVSGASIYSNWRRTDFSFIKLHFKNYTCNSKDRIQRLFRLLAFGLLGPKAHVINNLITHSWETKNFFFGLWKQLEIVSALTCLTIDFYFSKSSVLINLRKGVL